jgi:hypothetical protein
MNVASLTLFTGHDLLGEIERYVRERRIEGGFVMACVGSIDNASIRLAGARAAAALRGRFEIISLSGTLAPEGVRLNIALADSTGTIVGGRVMKGCRVASTVELVIGSEAGLRFPREGGPASMPG